MKKEKRNDSNKLNNKEKALLSSFENDEWKSVKNLKKEKSSTRKTATKLCAKMSELNSSNKNVPYHYQLTKINFILIFY